MKLLQKLLFAALALGGNMGAEAAKVPTVTDVQPAFWWAGMKNAELQVLLRGNSIGACSVSLPEGIHLDSIVRPANPNYLLLYINTADTAPQRFNITLTQGRRSVQVPYELRQRSGRQPQLWDAADVVYLLMPDRFADGDPQNNVVDGLREAECRPDLPNARHGGDLQGVIDHLDYLDILGVTTLWMTPILTNDMPAYSYHGYAITDYYNVDPRFGSNALYRDLVTQAHARGIKVVQDMVFNHCGRENVLFTNMPDSTWFNHGSNFVQTSFRTGVASDPHAAQTDITTLHDGWFVSEMPDWNQRNPHVLHYLTQTALFWMEYAGIDGVRMDTYPYADKEAMAQWCRQMDLEYPGMNIVGEAWLGSNVGVAYWQKDSKVAGGFNSYLPTVMDFPLTDILTHCFREPETADAQLSRIYDYLAQDLVYANPLNLLLFLENHDTDRFFRTSDEATHLARYRQALAVLLTLRGIPQLYYGTEVGLFGAKAEGDGPMRRDFPKSAFTESERTPMEWQIFDYTSRLLNWRKTSGAVRGTLTHFPVSDGCYVYSRQGNGERVTVIVNSQDKTVSLPLARYAEVLPAAKAYDVAGNAFVTLGETLQVPPCGVLVLDFGKQP